MSSNLWNKYDFSNAGLIFPPEVNPANIRIDEDVLKTSWRRLLSWSSEDVLIKINIFTLALRLQKTSSRRLQGLLVNTNIFVSAICLQNVFKTFSRCLQDASQKRLQDILKTYSRHLQGILPKIFQDVFKASSSRLAKTSSIHPQDALKTFWRRLHDVFKTSPRRLAKISLRRFQDVSSS